MLRTTRTAALSAILLIPLVISAPAARQAQAPTQPAASYTYRGTVHAVNAPTGSLDLLTGVGMALRLVHMTAGPAVRTSASTVGLRVTDLKPGDVVRVECRRTSAGLVVDRIEKFEAPAR
ncbi:MAG TPA: hypothetical protein VEU74_00095 [Gemmatimonadales bacterium]|nr:hypothetical protein [Gemmatimonadales bacterium]